MRAVATVIASLVVLATLSAGVAWRSLAVHRQARRRWAAIRPGAGPRSVATVEPLAARWRQWSTSWTAAALHMRPGEYRTVFGLAAGIGAGLGAILGGLGAIVLGTAGGPVVVYLGFRFYRQRWLKAVDAALPDAFRALAQALRAGSSLAQGLQLVGQQIPDPLGAEWRRVIRRGAFGVPLSVALTELAARVPSPDLTVALVAMQVQQDIGGPLAPLLDSVVTALDERRRLRAEVRTLTAMGRMSGAVLMALPLGLLAALAVLNPGYLTPLWATGLGHAMIGYGAGSMLVGGILVWRLAQGPSV
jgi:tight adherence protein B